MRDDLKTRRKELKERLAVLSGQLAAAQGGPHAGDGADVLCVARDAAQTHAAEVEVASLYAALRRMDDGSYGLCASCGADITQGRLDAFPFTSHCGECTPQAS